MAKTHEFSLVLPVPPKFKKVMLQATKELTHHGEVPIPLKTIGGAPSRFPIVQSTKKDVFLYTSLSVTFFGVHPFRDGTLKNYEH